MRRALVLAAVAAMLVGVLAVPATAAPPQQCNARLLSGAGLYGVPAAPTSSPYIGNAVQDQQVRVIDVVSGETFARYEIEAKDDDGIMLRRFGSQPFSIGGGFTPGLEMTKQLEKCLAKRF